MKFLTIIPAHGKDYERKDDVLYDWNKNKDFIIKFMDGTGSYTNKESLENKRPVGLNIMYNKQRYRLQIIMA